MKNFTVPGVSIMDLFTVECPTHGIKPVGFFQQLPRAVDEKAMKVTVTLQCHDCDFKKERTYDIHEKAE